ncbi:MAG: hypothetical protein JXJ22_02880 [Bacteroidales bacterium]|nr:hypothetical protein [Bacteroidales bacterium]
MNISQTVSPLRNKQLYLTFVVFFFFQQFLLSQTFTELNSSIKGTVYSSLEIKSKILGAPVRYTLYLPPGYFGNDRRFPVLYLLHGYGGDENSWTTRASIHQIADSLIVNRMISPFIIVMPDAKGSYYINDYKKLFPYEDFFIDEFIPVIDSLYKTQNQFSGRGIGGLSMGGFGAVVLPVKHPEAFGISLALSAAVRTDKMIVSLTENKFASNFAPLFGENLSDSARLTEHWKNNNPLYLINSENASELKNINWYIDCGMQDFLAEGNEALHQVFLKFNIPHEYHMRPGSHNWDYWNTSIIYALKYFSKHIYTKNGVASE